MKDIEEILDWQTRAVTEAFFESQNTGKPIKVTVTQKLIDKHKSNATQQIKSLLLDEKIDELTKIQSKDLQPVTYKNNHGHGWAIPNSIVLERLNELNQQKKELEQ